MEDKSKKAGALSVELFAPLSSQDRDALAEESESLLRFATDGQTELDVRFESAGQMTVTETDRQT